MIRFRGHHLVCLHLFRGEGYNEGFVRALTALMERAGAGEPVTVVSVADDLCAACPYLEAGECRHKEGAEAEIREMDEAALGLLGVSPNDVVSWADLRARLPEVMPAWRERFCGPCDWRRACEAALRG